MPKRKDTPPLPMPRPKRSNWQKLTKAEQKVFSTEKIFDSFLRMLGTMQQEEREEKSLKAGKELLKPGRDPEKSLLPSVKEKHFVGENTPGHYFMRERLMDSYRDKDAARESYKPRKSTKRDKPKMMQGGMANKKLHSYSGGGSVKDYAKKK
jgi:hypothetical protein